MRCRHEPELGQLAARCRPASAVILRVRTTAVVRIGEESREGHSPCRLPSAGDFEAPTGSSPREVPTAHGRRQTSRSGPVCTVQRLSRNRTFGSIRTPVVRSPMVPGSDAFEHGKAASSKTTGAESSAVRHEPPPPDADSGTRRPGGATARRWLRRTRR
jgi:hypothetical protein